jgi:molybdopterin-containing oxidoreductase family iron-sulfur binding subunit
MITPGEVFAPDGPFEKAASVFVEGPFYVAAEEVMPDLAAVADDVKGDFEDPTGKGFPVDRRDFMRLFGAGAVATAAAGCINRPVEHAIPYVQQPIDQIVGVPTFYATTCNICPAACGVVVKTREGRPAKLEGNPSHPVSQGGLCAMGQASIQGLYHPERTKGPTILFGKKHEAVEWEESYTHLSKKITASNRVAIVTSGTTGSSHEFYREFLRTIGAPESNLYTWEPNSLFASMGQAHLLAFGNGSLPRLDLRQAKVIVGIGSDFLDVGVSPVYNNKSFSQAHAYQNGAMGRLVQFESTMSLTGGRADERHPIPVGSELLTALLLLRSLHENPAAKGTAIEKARVKEILDSQAELLATGPAQTGLDRDAFDKLAGDLLKDKSVVLAGGSSNFDENSTTLQLATILVNTMLGAYGTILFYDRGWMPSPVRSGDMRRFLSEVDDLDVVIFIDTNPAFTVPAAWGLKEKLAKIPTVVSMQPFPNETENYAHYVMPNHHMLESWGDEQPVGGFYSVRQPAVRPLTNSRQAEDSLLWIAANAGKSLPYANYLAYLTISWKKVFDYVGTNVTFDIFFKGLLRRGHIGKLPTRTVPEIYDIKPHFKVTPMKAGLKLVASLDHRFQDGRGAHLPILQEIGDGMTSIAWDSWVSINPNTCRKLGVKKNDIILIEGPGGSFKAAVYPMPGLHPDTIEAPRGNGHLAGISKITDGIGFDPLIAFARDEDHATGQPVTAGQPVKISLTTGRYRLATMQKHNDLANRKEIVKRISLATAVSREGKTVDLDTVPDMYPALPQATIRWGLAVDLNKCTGCGACMAACAVENNVPQVGRDQINMGREMHWIRLDRYFHGDVDNPQVTFQPIMCQHCNHAPCEAVCPVYATTHDPEGINSMTYNRCVGTRYCANACPYKVRRFNWWTHKWGTMGDRLQDRNLRAMNPDVTVRTRGVMEKCNFCLGRLRDAKHQAKQWATELRDGDARTACQQTCPADAITFGNLNDPTSRISQARKNSRAYLVLGGDPEIGHYGLKTLPNVSYLADVLIEMPEDSAVHPHGPEHS